MRVKTYHDDRSKSTVPVLCEFPFDGERQAVIAHECAHLLLNHSKGIVQLNGLMAISSLAFWFRPVWSLIPLAFYGFCFHTYSKHAELAADRQTCITMGPEITKAMINRHTAKKTLDDIIIAKYTIDQPAFRSTMTEKIFSYLFHVPIDERLAHLNKILQEQTKTTIRPSSFQSL